MSQHTQYQKAGTATPKWNAAINNELITASFCEITLPPFPSLLSLLFFFLLSISSSLHKTYLCEDIHGGCVGMSLQLQHGNILIN